MVIDLLLGSEGTFKILWGRGETEQFAGDCLKAALGTDRKAKVNERLKQKLSLPVADAEITELIETYYYS